MSLLPDDARKAFEESAQYYKSLISEIVNGNLHCKINRRIKRVHLKVLEILKDKDFEKIQQFYQVLISYIFVFFLTDLLY